ncbi:hypothetical protein [Thermosporothrix hazakensis]|uniref:hypothetical protein n=1 Tax=Thermosporothrix hazakensis TaxID=644383 RepID=UPI0014764DC3|nr:hypothetical protein [Thermosporothrix hazakensis]
MLDSFLVQAESPLELPGCSSGSDACGQGGADTLCDGLSALTKQELTLPGWRTAE